MNEEKTQIADGVASELNAELGMACVGCVSEFKNELRCYDCTVTNNGKGSNFLDVEDLPEPTTEKMQKQVRRSIIAAMRFLGINSDGV